MTSPGIYRNLSWDEYRAIDAWNPSSVLPGRVSALEIDYQRRHPKQSTPQMRFGSAVHCAVLEPDQFPLRYCMWEGRRAGAKYDEFRDVNEGKEVLTLSEYDACLAARDSARKHPVASRFLTAGETEDAEVAVVWEDIHTGLLCKSRIDLLLLTIIDLKTTKTKVADDRALTRIASRFGYHISMAARQDAISTLTGETPDVKLIFVEQLPPYDVRVKSLPDIVMGQGYDIWQNLLSMVADCERTGIWPGCDAGESELQVWDEGNEQVQVTLDGIVI